MKLFRFRTKTFFVVVVVVASFPFLIYAFLSMSSALNFGCSEDVDVEATSQSRLEYLRRLGFASERDADSRVDCVGVLEGDDAALERADRIERLLPRPLNATELLSSFSAASCAATLRDAQFPFGNDNKDNNNNKDDGVRMAIGILVCYEAPEQVFRLIRSLYDPSNVYCLHVDSKVDNETFSFYSRLSDCLPNLHLAAKRINGVYASWTRLDAEFACMESMNDLAHNWTYYLNYAGSEFPLRTNDEMARILRRYRKQNDIEGIEAKNLRNRWEKIFNISGDPPSMKQTKVKKNPPPHNLKIVKGSAYGAFTRKFVKFVLRDKIAREFYEWSKDTYSPDEFFWSTLQYNPHIKAPGGSSVVTRTSWRARYSNWLTKSEPPCEGVRQRGLCVFGIRDLQRVFNLQWYALNKFSMTASRLALECLEEWHRNRSSTPLREPIEMNSYPLTRSVKRKEKEEGGKKRKPGEEKKEKRKEI